MIELFYFSGSDLMIKVEYVKKNNSLLYASHRDIGHNEREMAEQYIMAEVAPKTDFHRKRPSQFVYLGTDKRLEKRLVSFHQKNETELLTRNEKEIDESVKSLINNSMCNYYTEKIGDLIVFARNELKNNRQYEPHRANLKQQMNDLLNAYNFYADQKLTLNEIIPAELKPYWPGLDETRYNIALPQ